MLFWFLRVLCHYIVKHKLLDVKTPLAMPFALPVCMRSSRMAMSFFSSPGSDTLLGAPSIHAPWSIATCRNSLHRVCSEAVNTLPSPRTCLCMAAHGSDCLRFCSGTGSSKRTLGMFSRGILTSHLWPLFYTSIIVRRDPKCMLWVLLSCTP